MKQNFVTFYSPGTFCAEETTKKIDEWDVNIAIEMSKDIKERYGALPYGFEFSTRERLDNELDSSEVARSGTYFLGGEVLTVDQLKKLNNPDDRILILNLESNGYKDCVVNTNSWKWTMGLRDKDTVLVLN